VRDKGCGLLGGPPQKAVPTKEGEIPGHLFECGVWCTQKMEMGGEGGGARSGVGWLVGEAVVQVIALEAAVWADADL
jgi:hypothetical protein